MMVSGEGGIQMRNRLITVMLIGTAALLAAATSAAWSADPASTPKPAASPRSKTGTTNPTTESVLMVEGTVVQVAAGWFDLEVSQADKRSSGVAAGSRIRFVQSDRTRVLREGLTQRGLAIRVGEKVHITAKVTQDGGTTTYTAKIIRIVQASR
jgi:hypothetical protein